MARLALNSDDLYPKRRCSLHSLRMNLFQAQFSDQLIVCFMVVGTFVYNSWQRLILVTLSNSNNTPLYSFPFSLHFSLSSSLPPSLCPSFFMVLRLSPRTCAWLVQPLFHGATCFRAFQKEYFLFSRWKGIYCFFVRELQEKCPCMFFRDSKNIL